MLSLKDANDMVLSGYPYGEGVTVHVEALKRSCLTPGNGRDFNTTETVTPELLNEHCELLLSKMESE